LTVKEINNMHLQNVVMQLRKVCSHPILFEGPRMHEQVMDDELVDESGKMMVLERLLDALFARGHKVLVFSQFVTMLDVIEVCGIPLAYGKQLDSSSLVVGLGVRVQGLAIVPHRRLNGPTGTPRRDGPFPERRQRARRTTSVLVEHTRRRARHQPDRSRHSRVLRPRLGA
jgi:hypothetical protein